MKRHVAAFGLFAALTLLLSFEPAGLAGGSTDGGGPAPKSIRMQKDTVGYATKPSQVEALVRLVDSLEARRSASNEAAFPKMRTAPMIGAICPHDDYLYAGRGYVHVMREVKAPTVVLFGVSHTARRRGIQDKLIFEDFRAWKVGGQLCPVSPLRKEVIKALPPDLVLVNDTIQSEEHSLEGFIPILQYYDPKVQILPILVTKLNEQLREEAADTLATILAKQFKRRGWKLGTDVVILVSADCVHYGDEEWGGRNYAPFGTGTKGYEMGVDQDISVIKSALVGKLGPEKIATFRGMVDNNDLLQPYKITWCGVYSIPFGLSILDRLCARAHRPAPEGRMLVYGTSINPRKLKLEYTGLGTTAISTLNHWVGYTGIGYW
jgi:AmmeMemoRadiSam system protein B